MPKRRRGSIRAHRPGVARLARRHAAFEVIVERALDGIPLPFSRALQEVAVVIEDEPSDRQLREHGLGRDEVLYGLYEGVPRTEWGADWVAAPNKISIFRLPLEEDFADPDELEKEVRITVVHELAHHLGIDDDRLTDLGAN
jgi:predicted Zn-dependent protease with MMP-like domain